MKLLIFDSNSIINRAFYGVRLLTAKDGSFTNAIYGFFNITFKVLDDFHPDEVAFAFDLPGGTFRNRLYNGYKANRKGMPPELAQQLPVVKQLIKDLGYPVLELPDYEADDILGTVSGEMEKQGHEVLLCTGDRDSLQLVSDKVTVILATTKAGGAEYIPMTPAAVEEKYTVKPVQLIDVKALQGDTSDNIPGVVGIGEKTAQKLVHDYRSLDEIYAGIDSLSVSESVKNKLRAGKDSAYLSQKLGKICRTAPLDCKENDFTRGKINEESVVKTLSRLELFRLLGRLGLSGEPVVSAESTEERKTVPGIRTERLPEEGRVLLVQKDGKAYTYDGKTAAVTAWHPQEGLPEQAEWMVPDSKALYHEIQKTGKEPDLVALDLSLAAYLLNPNASDYTPERLLAEYGIGPVGIDFDGDEEDKQNLALAVRLYDLAGVLTKELEKRSQTELLYTIEQPLARVLSSMEAIGFKADKDGLISFGKEIGEQAKKTEQEIFDLAGHDFNIASPKQLGDVLFEELGLPAKKKTKTGYSTDAEVLESLEPYHPIIGKILEYRKLSKLLSTYVEGLQKQIEPDGRIRTSFLQTETRTGRLSSAEPNLQNIPVRSEPGSRMREFFVAEDGKVLVDADYSQIELRVLASIASDETMIQAFKDKTDIHTLTASQVFDLPPLFVTPLMRSRAKAVNFGIVYGIGAFSLSKDIGVTVKEADKYIKSYLETYDGVDRYMKNVVEQAKANGYAETLFHRRRYLPELTSSNHMTRAFGERVARNMPIQGTAADIIKVAMIRVYERLKAEKMASKLVLQVHDELIVEAPEEEAERVKILLQEEMEHAADLAVQLTVDAKIGKDWATAH